MQLRRLRSPAECEAVLAATEPLEPRTTIVDAALLLGPTRHRRLSVVDEEDRILGVAVIERLAVDHWKAWVTLLDAVAAPLLARVIDRSQARSVGGPIEDVEPLVGHMRRARLF